jgi:transcription elongation GreA/GreB family factor
VIENKSIDKKLIIEHLTQKLKVELIEIEAAAQSAKDLATGPDMKAEGKYDTRAIEASYLAGAQAKRVEEIKLDIQMLEDLDLAHNDLSKIQLGSLVILVCNNQERFYFVSSTSGGSLLVLNDQPILIISVFSPIGDAALGLSIGETFEVETPKENRSYFIKNIF